MFWVFLLAFIIGVCVGSFLNVAIFRTHEGEPVVKSRSKCRTCEEPIGARDLVPVLSYILLQGRCRRCKSFISWQYPVVEVVTGLLFVLMVLKIQLGVTDNLSTNEIFVMLIRDWVFVSYLVIIFVYDLRHMLIIDRFTIPAMIFALIANLWLGVIPAWSLIAGGLVLSGFFLLQFVVSKGTWVGGGDIRMGALMGFMLGFVHGLVALFLAYVIGAIAGIIILSTGKGGRKTEIPFGTFLAIATVIVLFAGQPIIDWYLGFFL